MEFQQGIPQTHLATNFDKPEHNFVIKHMLNASRSTVASLKNMHHWHDDLTEDEG